MNDQVSIIEQYGSSDFASRVEGALQQAGLGEGVIPWMALAPLDQFHVSGAAAKTALAEKLAIPPGATLLDMLVNNAGIIEPIARLADSDPEQWARVADVNYRGVYHGLRAAIPVIAAQGSGVIVNISSGAATGALEGWSHYCSTKAAVLSLTRCADKEYRAEGVQVVGLSPGTVATEMQAAIKASGLNLVSQLGPSVHIPPEWAAHAVAWLCTEEAGALAGVDFSLKDAASRARAGLGA